MTIVNTCAEEEFHPTGDPDFAFSFRIYSRLCFW